MKALMAVILAGSTAAAAMTTAQSVSVPPCTSRARGRSGVSRICAPTLCCAASRRW